MAQNGFKAFLQSRRWSDELGRKFVDHALGDNQLPDARSWQELEAYLKGQNAPGKGSKPPNTSGSSTWGSVRAMPKGPPRREAAG
jgi:hypothetical protein